MIDGFCMFRAESAQAWFNYYVRHKAETHEIGDFSAQGLNLPKMHMPTCLKRRVVVNRTSVSSLSSIAFDKIL